MRLNKLLIVVFFLLVSAAGIYGQTVHAKFETLYDLIKEKNFFKAREVYEADKSSLSTSHQLFFEAVLDNAFNKLSESNKKIEKLAAAKSTLPDSLMIMLYNTKIDNAVKLYDYAAAMKASDELLMKYERLLSQEEARDTKNSLKIWKALEKAEPQKVVKKGDSRLKMVKDKAGLNNLHVTVDTAAVDFIFDTGANLSTITTTAAKKFSMKIIPVEIEVGTIMGTKVQAQLGICEKMMLGDIEIRNAIFLVMDDKALGFPQIGYQIHGILGFPVIDGLGEIQISQAGFFMVPKNETTISTESNMAMDGLTPLVYANDMHFSFDTGANETILYAKYYKKYQQQIDSGYTLTTMAFGGAGGQTMLEGYKVSASLNILDKRADLKSIGLLKNDLKDKEHLYGNIGQDVIRQFDTMTINFDKMFIRFE